MRGPPIAASAPSGSALPPALRVRLYELFVQIEREFEVLYSENLGLQERIEWLSSEQQQQQQLQQLTQQQQHHHHHHNNSSRSNVDNLDSTPATNSVASIMNSMTASLPKGMSRGIYAHKIRSAESFVKKYSPFTASFSFISVFSVINVNMFLIKFCG